MVGIISNSAALFAQRNLEAANSLSESSIARLSSGNRIIKASDDVSGLAVGTVLASTVSTLRTILQSAGQAASLLSIADGGLQNVGEILQRQQSLAVSANSGSLSDNERAFLNQEFQQLVAEIDRLVEGTNFNGVQLIDGSIFDSASVSTATNTAAANFASANFSFSADAEDADTVQIIGGDGTSVTFEFDADATSTAGNVAITGIGSAADGTDVATLLGDAIVTARSNASLTQAQRDLLNEVSVSVAGASVALSSSAAGTIGNELSVVEALNTAASISFAGTLDFTGGADSDLSAGRVGVSGTVNNDVLSQASGIAASGTLTFATAIATDVFVINGVTFNVLAATTGASTDVLLGGSDTAQATNAVAVINAYEGLGVTATSALGVVTITANDAGSAGNDFDIASVDATITASAATLSGGADSLNGIGGDVAAGNIQFIANAAATETIVLGGVTFTFATAATAVASDPTSVAIGDTIAETIDNLVLAVQEAAVVNNGSVTAANQEILSPLEVSRDGNTFNIAYNNRSGSAGGTVDGDLFTTTSTIAGANAIVSGATLTDQSSVVAIDTSGISNNAAFAGTLSGFSAAYSGTNDEVTLSITIGDVTYQGVVEDTDSNIPVSVRLNGDVAGTGYFEIRLGENGQAVSDQSGASSFAARLDSAFSGLSFSQERTIDSYTGAGDLTNASGTVFGSLNASSFSLIGSNFANTEISAVNVQPAPAGQDDVIIEVVINGETYRSQAGIGEDTVGFTLLSTTDANNRIVADFGGRIDLGSAENVTAFQSALESAFGVGQGGSALSFQVGTASTDSISVALESATTANIYRDNTGAFQTLDISTAGGASSASAVLENAVNSVVALRSQVGALQSRFDFVSANVSGAIQNTEAARSSFLDVDIASESTDFATAQVRLQASISVLAQANQLPQNLLKLIG